MITVLTRMSFSFPADFSSSARRAYLFILSGQIFVKLLLRATATSLRSSVLLALSSSTTSAPGSCFGDSSSPGVAVFQPILFSVPISFPRPTFKQKLVVSVATFLRLLNWLMPDRWLTSTFLNHWISLTGQMGSAAMSLAHVY